MESLRNTLDKPGRAGVPIAAGIVSAIGASACCVGPLVLVAIGLGGAWVSGLRALAPLFPVFVALAVGAFGFAFWRLYVAPRRCAPDVACASPRTLRRRRIAFWVALAAGTASLLFPFYGPQLLA
ncbi:MAG: mercuric transporter MerT family protein [Burkholderiales bacterium]